MTSLDLTATAADRPTGVWAACLLEALARDEAAGRRPARLTEASLATWRRFQGRLSSADFLALLFEDAAVLHQIPFDPAAVGGPLHPDRLPAAAADAWLAALPSLPLTTPGADHVAAQAKRLGLPTRLARAELSGIEPHHRILEMPGTGGQVAHHLVATRKDLTLSANFVVACATWQERTLAGIVGLDLAAPNADFIAPVELADLRSSEHALRKPEQFDVVVALHPDRGGLFDPNEQLARWFQAGAVGRSKDIASERNTRIILV